MASQQPAQQKVASEDIIRQKTDLCISNAIVKTGIGFSAGVVLSVLLLKRRAFPVWLSTGFGMGSAYTDCERSFNPVAVPGIRVVPSGPTSVSASSNVPQTTFEKLQQKAGEAFGAAKDKAAAGVDKAQDKSANLAEKAQEKGREVVEKAKVEGQKLEDKAFHIHSPFEQLSTGTAASPTGRLPGSDCLGCRLTGFAAMAGLGTYSLVEAYKIGAFRRGPLPSGAKARPVWGATLVLFGLGCVGAGVVRLTV